MALGTNDFKDGITYTGALTATPVGPFVLLGGKYLWTTSAPSTSTTLEILMPDGSTYQAVIAAVTAASSTMLDLPPGTYQIIFTATGAVQGSLVKVPMSIFARTAREARQDRQKAKAAHREMKAARKAEREAEREARIAAGIVGAPVEGRDELEIAQDAFAVAVRERQQAKDALVIADAAVMGARRHLEALSDEPQP